MGRPFPWARLAAAAALAIAAPGLARAEDVPRATLVYTSNDTKGSCPDERGLRERVAARLGVDPFAADASLAFAVVVSPRGPVYVATIEVRSARDAPAIRTLDDRSCPALIDTVASTVALTIDPIGHAPRAETAPSLPPLPAPEERRAEPPSRDDRGPRPAPPKRNPPPGLDISPSATLDGVAHAGLAPSPTFGARFGLGLASKRLAIHAEGTAETTAAAGGSRDEVVAQVFAAHAVPCLTLTPALLACADVTLGVVRARARLGTNERAAADPLVGLGARVGLRLPLSRSFWLRAQAEGGAPLVRVDYTIDGARAASNGPVYAGLSLGLEVRAP